MRHQSMEEDTVLVWERMSWEIKGSIFTLLTLFELVALTSYIPIDSFNLFNGRIDHINNLGGIVGAVMSEWFFGTVGIVGYSIVFLTAWLAFWFFRQMGVRAQTFKIIGVIVGTLLAAVTCHIFFRDQVPEASLFQGGWVGKTLGDFLCTYFNTTGAILIISFSFLITLILTTGLSVARFVRSLEGKNAETEETRFDEETIEDSRAKHETPKPAPVHPQFPAERKVRSRRAVPREEGPHEVEQMPLAKEGPAGKALESQEETPAITGPGECRELIAFAGAYPLPSTRLLKTIDDGSKRISRGELKKISKKICEHLLSFQITGEMEAVSEGPIVFTYEFKPSAGVRLSKIAALQEDLGVVLGTRELRIIAPIPGKTVVGIEVPRENPEIISLKELLGQDKFYEKKIKIPVAIGKSTFGDPIFGDLTTMPHLLVAGATGTGKSVFINSIVMSLIFRMNPQQLRMILIDPKMLELNAFDGIPHLVSKVITDNNAAYNALAWAVNEMERRYCLMAESASKNIESYNSKQKNPAKTIPYIVIVVDELADLMFSGGEAVEIAITRLAQKARAAGIHLLIATQRPSTDVITGLIKANIPSRISFKVPSGIDSRTILDTGGAEELIGRGDMLMLQPGIPVRRLHGCFVTEEDLLRVVKYVTGGRNHTKNYIDFTSGSAGNVGE